MSYRPTFRRQFGDPTTWLDPYLCTMECGAMALDFHTKGAISLWGGQLVPWCGLTPAQIAGQAPRQDGELRTGTSLANVGMAWLHWGQKLGYRTGQSWDQAMLALAEGRAVILQGDYDQFSLATRCQDSFLGDHAVLVLPETSGTKLLVGDPLCSVFRWVEGYELFRYADKLGINGRLFYAVTGPLSEAGPGVPPTDTEADVGPRTINPRETPIKKIRILPGSGRFGIRTYDGAAVPIETSMTGTRDVACVKTIDPAVSVPGVGTFSGDAYEIGVESVLVLERDAENATPPTPPGGLNEAEIRAKEKERIATVSGGQEADRIRAL